MDQVTVVLRSRRRARAAAVQKLQHLLPAVILLGGGAAALMRHAEGAELWIAVVEVVSGALFVAAAARGIRGAIRPKAGEHVHHHGIDWVDVFAAAVMFAETLEHYHRTGHVVRPNVVMIVTLLLFAVLHDRIIGFAEHRRALRISDEGLSIGGRPFRRALRASWSAIRAIDVGDRYASIETRDGRSKRLDLQDLENAPAVRVALQAAQDRLSP